MSSSRNDDFVHVRPDRPRNPASHKASVADEFYQNSQGLRQYTEGLMVTAIRKKHPKFHLTVSQGSLLAFGAYSDDVTYSVHGNASEAMLERYFMPPTRRYNDESGGSFAEKVVYGCYDFVYKGDAFLLYIIEGVDPPYSKPTFNYILVDDATVENKTLAQKKTDDLLAAAMKWQMELHNEILVFDQGYWQPNKELFKEVQKSNWEDVILEKERKGAIIDDVIGFFDAEERYAEFGVPWKRGVIFYGPPGNGKTISTKALMHDMSKRMNPNVESLYVKSLASYGGPEYAIRQIFQRARALAPCLLIFEDIDSLVSPLVRSYFLNEVDGLESNHGILMIASTNHLDRLDPGLAKRPSRFDRKYLFDVPSHSERIQYAEYWRNKLKNNKKVDFPTEMSARIADITADFSFAYMKEAFVAALLVIVARSDEKQKFRHREDDLSDNILWKELKKQVDSLRKEMDGDDDDQSMGMSGMWPALNNILDERDERTQYAPPAHMGFGGPRPEMARQVGGRFAHPVNIGNPMAPMDFANPMPRYF